MAVIQGRQQVREMAQDALARLYEIQPTARWVIEGAAGEFGASTSVAATADRQGGMLSGALSVSPGVFVYQVTNTGLAAPITASGTKFFKDEALN